MIKDWKKDILTIPNLLSLFRLILIPVYITIFLNANGDSAHYYIAAGILAVSCLTDLIDGKIARHFNMISNLGKILDPVADKATQFSLIICLVIEKPVLWILAILFIVKESFQIIAGGIALKKGRMLKGALISGKICTTVLFISLILMVMLFPSLSDKNIHVLVIIDAICMLVAFTEYLFTYLKRENKFQYLNESENNP